MFSKTPIELLVKDFSNIYNKCQSLYELVSNRRFNEQLAILTTAEVMQLLKKPMYAAIHLKNYKLKKSKNSSMPLTNSTSN